MFVNSKKMCYNTGKSVMKEYYMVKHKSELGIVETSYDTI